MDPEHCAHYTGAPNEHGNGNKSRCEGKHKKAPLQVPRMSEVNVNCNEEELPEEPFEPLTQEVSVPLTQASPLRTTKDVNRSEQNVGAGWQLSREPGDLVSTPQSEEKKMYMTEDEDEMDVMEQIVFPLTQEVSLPLTQKVSSLHRTGSPGEKKQQRKSEDSSKKVKTSDKTVGDGRQVSREASPQLMELENVRLREAEVKSRKSHVSCC
ncbi:uncharacterized protein LOC144011538 [Festucalex cinctus]